MSLYLVRSDTYIKINFLAEAILGEMVEKGKDYKGPHLINENDTIKKACKAANDIFHDRLSQIRTEVSRNNDTFVERRLESLRTSYKKKINMKEEQLRKAKDRQREERYIRMLEGTLRRLRAELKEKERKLELQRNIEVEYDEIAAGILEVSN